MVLSFLNSMHLVYMMYADIPSQYDLPNCTNQQFLQLRKPWLINFKRYNSACRHYFQKPPNRIVHLSNHYSATRMYLAYSGGLCSAFTQLAEFLFHAAIYWFSHAIVTCMRPFDHMLYAAWASNWLMLHGYPANLLTILGALNQPSLSVSKSLQKAWAVSRSQQHHLSFIWYWSAFCLYYSHLTQISTISLSLLLQQSLQRSNEPMKQVKHGQNQSFKSCDYYANHKTTCGVHTQSRCACAKNRTRP